MLNQDKTALFRVALECVGAHLASNERIATGTLTTLKVVRRNTAQYLVKALHDPLTIEVFRANTRSRAIYEHYGFAEESSHVDETTELEAVIMKMTR